MRYLALIVSLILLPTVSPAQSIRIKTIKIIDNTTQSNSLFSSQVDLLKGVCLEDPENPTPEEFNDSLVKLSVLNKSNGTIKIKKFYFIIEPYGGTLQRVRSKALAPFSGFYIAKDEVADVSAFFLDATTSGEKAVFGARTLNNNDYGIRNVRFFLEGRTANNRQFRISARQAVSFDNFNRCQ